MGLLGSGGVIRGLCIAGTFPGAALGVSGSSQQLLDNEILAGHIGISIAFLAGHPDRRRGPPQRDHDGPGAGIEIRGANARLLRNTVIDVDHYGLYASGLDPVVEDNRVRHTGGSFVERMPCTGGDVRGT